MSPEDLDAILARAEAVQKLKYVDEEWLEALRRAIKIDIPALVAEVRRLQGWRDGYKGAAFHSVAIAKEVSERLEQAERERDEARVEIEKCHAIALDYARERDEARAALAAARALCYQAGKADEAHKHDKPPRCQCEACSKFWEMYDNLPEAAKGEKL